MVKLNWSVDQESSFLSTKEAVGKINRLVHADLVAAISAMVNSSNTHVGAMLQQWSTHGWQHLSF